MEMLNMDPRLVEPNLLRDIVRAHAGIPVADIYEFRGALDHIEAELKTSGTDLKRLYGFADTLTNTMGWRASTAEVCEEVLHDRKDQINRIVDLAAKNSASEAALRIPHEIIRGAYAAIDFTRDGRPGRVIYERIEQWKYDGSTVDAAQASVEAFRAILNDIFDEVAVAVDRRRGA
jgi:hypothetical protein